MCNAKFMLRHQGFISLIFVLGICMTLTTWVGISSSQVFAYIQARKVFQQYRDGLRSVLACADVVLDREIRTHLQNVDNAYDIDRALYIDDMVQCRVSDKNVVWHSPERANIFFSVSADMVGSHLQVLAEVKNGFIVSIHTKYIPQSF